MNPNIFREYDIRGIVGSQLTDETVDVLARAIGTYFRQNDAKRIAIGYDARASSPRFCEILTRGLNASGCDVVLIGMVPTPVLYHTTFTQNVDGGVMITGSHNPPDHNGFKISVGTATLFGSQIQEIKEIATVGQFENGSGSVETIEVLAEYCGDIVSRISLGASVGSPHVSKGHAAEDSTHPEPRRLKAVIDGGNGMGGVTAVPVYRALGIELIELFTDPDSTFPNHHADPTVEANLQDLIAAVREHKADIGIAFDGDGDRIGVVDEKGRIMWGDELTILIARSILADRPGSTIISEVKCSQNLYDDIEKHGGTGIMWKAGHSIIKAKMKETGAVLAGEMSGHIFFADRFYGFDDATYAGARVLEILSKTDVPLSQMLADLPKLYSTPELRMYCPDETKFQVVQQIAEYFSRDHEVITIDGARIKFENGWGLVRPSNTQAILVLRFEADSEIGLTSMRAKVESQVAKLVAAAGTSDS